MFCHSSDNFFSAALCWRGCVALPFSLKYPKGVLFDSSQVTYLPGYSFHFTFETLVNLAVCFGSLSCWNIPLLPSFWRLLVSQYFGISISLQAPSINVSLINTFCTHAGPDHTTTMLHGQDYVFTVVVLARFRGKHDGPHLSQTKLS